MERRKSTAWTRCLLGRGVATSAMAVAVLGAHGVTAADRADGAAAVDTKPPAQAVREIDDPNTGAHWLLLRDPGQNGGPGRLLLLGNAPGSNRKMARSEVLGPPGAHDPSDTEESVSAPPPLVIRGGDRLVVEESTAVVEARLAAVALGPAAIGSRLRARLEIGGRVVRVVALGPGRAALAPEIEVRP